MSDAPQKSPLQGMIDSAAPGAVIKLRPGEYLGAVVIDKPVTLEGHGKKTWIGAKTSPVVLVKCGGVKLRNVMIEASDGGDALLAFPGTGPAIDAVDFRGKVVIAPRETGAARPAQRVDALFEKADAAWDNQDWACAAEYYRDILGLDPSESEAQRFLNLMEEKMASTPLQETQPTMSGSLTSARLPRDPRAEEREERLNAELRTAASEGDLKKVSLLLELGAGVNEAKIDGWTPLRWAAWNGHVAVATALLENGADVNFGGKTGWTPLHFAAQQGRLDLARALLDRGADVNAACKTGWTPLSLARAKNLTQVVDLLLSRGARE